MTSKLGFASLILGLLSFFYYNYNGVFLEKPLAAVLLGVISLWMFYKDRSRGGMKTAALGVLLGVGYLVFVYLKLHNII